MTDLIGNLLGIDKLESVQDWGLRFVAPWAAGNPALVLFGCVALAAAAAIFYRRFQPGIRSALARAALMVGRAMVLVLLLLILAEPVLSLATTEQKQPLLVLLFDATDSMNIKDQLGADQRKRLDQLIDSKSSDEAKIAAEPSRAELLKKVLRANPDEVLNKLDEDYRLRAYVMDRADRVREIDIDSGESSASTIDAAKLAEQINPTGQVSAYGSALGDLYRRHQAQRVAGVVLFGDFNQNAGPPPLAAARRLAKPLVTVGLGPKDVVDLSVDLQAPLLLKKGEKVNVDLSLRQTGLQGRQGRVQLYTRRFGAQSGEAAQREFRPVGAPVNVSLDQERISTNLGFVPKRAGRFKLQARVEPFAGEALTDNNRAERDVTVRDESLRLLFVEYRPTWEWRFVKEVFHRDPLIGREGFRTFLRSASLQVRREDPMFLGSLQQPRSKFFSHDVIILSDVPSQMLSSAFQQKLKTFVSKFGGGLIVLSGSNFGPQALAGTQIADMLPVIPDPDAPMVNQPFDLQRTAAAAEAPFMNLGQSEAENDQAWANLQRLPWYQPVKRVHPLATVLAEHPRDTTVGGKQHQPLIATRRYGKGEVVYFAFNELWRLRRIYGEKYYRQLWGQLIYRLGLRRALGSQKRFVVRTDRRQYRAGDTARLTVEAYNADFQPLDQEQLNATIRTAGGASGSGGKSINRQIEIPTSGDEGVYKTSFPVSTGGQYRVLVDDPVTGEKVEIGFNAEAVSAERRRAVRDAALQRTLASQTGGKALELDQIANLPRSLKSQPIQIENQRRIPLWNTWLSVVLVLGLLLGEWLVRKLVNVR